MMEDNNRRTPVETSKQIEATLVWSRVDYLNRRLRLPPQTSDPSSDIVRAPTQEALSFPSPSNGTPNPSLLPPKLPLTLP